ncbi:transposase [Mesorhizobium huakuii]|uniref:transposase n=1 Tax=Mesorhizobium huakuii TaxID=28104 RepID=UPI003D7B71B4
MQGRPRHQGCLLEAALGERIGVSDEEWALIGPLLPAERGRGCRPAQENRRYFEGTIWIARTGRNGVICLMIWQMEQCLPPIPTMGRDGGVRFVARNARRDGGTRCHRRHDR